MTEHSRNSRQSQGCIASRSSRSRYERHILRRARSQSERGRVGGYSRWKPTDCALTVPLKEFSAVARTLTLEPAAPAMMVSEVGEAFSEKSGAGVAAATVKATVAAWLSNPEVPVNVVVALPTEAVEAALSVTFCAEPGVNISVAGMAVTPEGSPLIATVTVPVKPFAGIAFTLTVCPAPPAKSATAAGVRVIEKLGEGVEDGVV